MTNTDTERLARDLIEQRENLTRLQRELFQSLAWRNRFPGVLKSDDSCDARLVIRMKHGGGRRQWPEDFQAIYKCGTDTVVHECAEHADILECPDQFRSLPYVSISKGCTP
jgi:hypothetical protein